jgi:hypothetical protein
LNILLSTLFGLPEGHKGLDHLPGLSLVVLRDTIGVPFRAVRAIKIPGIPEVLISTKSTMKIHPMVRVPSLSEGEPKPDKAGLDLVEVSPSYGFEDLPELVTASFHTGHSKLNALLLVTVKTLLLGIPNS